MLRTWINEDGVFIHMGDLADSLERQVRKYGGEAARRPAAFGMSVVAEALRKTEQLQLQEAAERRRRNPFAWLWGG